MFRKTLIIFLAALSLGACSSMPAGGGQTSLEQSVEQLRLLMIDPDQERLSALLSNDLSYGHSAGKLDTKTSFVADLLSGASDFVTIETTGQTVLLQGNLGIVRHTLVAKTNDGGKPGAVTLKVLQVWTQTDGRWLLIARQAVRPPQQ